MRAPDTDAASEASTHASQVSSTASWTKEPAAPPKASAAKGKHAQARELLKKAAKRDDFDRNAYATA
eukprot:4710502-Alexandrium_andersonii.AAC.1